MTPPLVNLHEALEQTQRCRRHLLLGNGFSIAAHDGFRYASLMDEAKALAPSQMRILEASGAGDFEEAMRLAPENTEQWRDLFIRTVASIHPSRSEALTVDDRQTCAKFLSHFLREKGHPESGRIFTTNYDLLLCWVVVEHRSQLPGWDGFKSNLMWNAASQHRVGMFYLHGGLHLYEKRGPRRVEMRKLKADPYEARSLVQVVRDAVNAGEFPTFVSEGTHHQKVQRIRRSEYLMQASAALQAALDRPTDALFVHGHSLSDVDHHILSLIARARLRRVYVGVFGDRDTERVSLLSDRWNGYRRDRGLPPLELALYPSAATPIWSAARSAR